MTTPAWFPDRQNYAITQERERHDEVLRTLGEFSMFCLLWNRVDFDNGLVGLCLRCQVSRGLVAKTYQQSSDSKCPECFGTRYEGGFRALLVRPALWDTAEDVEATGARGMAINQTASVQTTADFRLRADDYIFRADGTRWQMRTIGSNNLRTGFGSTGRSDIVGYNFGTVSREDEDSVAYLIPPLPAVLTPLLSQLTHYQPDFSAVEVIRTPVAT